MWHNRSAFGLPSHRGKRLRSSVPAPLNTTTALSEKDPAPRRRGSVEARLSSACVEFLVPGKGNKGRFAAAFCVAGKPYCFLCARSMFARRLFRPSARFLVLRRLLGRPRARFLHLCSGPAFRGRRTFRLPFSQVSCDTNTPGAIFVRCRLRDLRAGTLAVKRDSLAPLPDDAVLSAPFRLIFELHAASLNAAETVPLR